MVVVCIGDSLTEGDYGIPGKSGIANVQPENYPAFLAQMTGYEVRNYGKCGYTSTSYLRYYDTGAVDVRGADVILIMLGTNGGMSGEQDLPGNRDYDLLVRRCRRDAPAAQIILCTPPHVTENRAYSNCGYARQVREGGAFVRRYAKEQGLPLIDCAALSDFTAETESVFQANDGLHFVRAGYLRLAERIRDAMRSLLPPQS